MTLGEYLGAGSGITKLLWHLNGNSNDSSGNGNNGTDISIDYGLAYGLFGQGALINNVNDEIRKATNLGIAGQDALTVSLWAKLTSEIGSGSGYFFLYTTTLTIDRFVQLTYEYNGGSRRLNLNVSGVGGYYSIALGTAAWYNFIVTRASGPSPACVLYMNGNAVISLTGGNATNGTNFFAMGVTGASLPSFSDEIIIENVAWDAAKIRKYYTWAKGRFVL